jgi:hypothetical protein
MKYTIKIGLSFPKLVAEKGCQNLTEPIDKNIVSVGETIFPYNMGLCDSLHLNIRIWKIVSKLVTIKTATYAGMRRCTLESI